MGIFDSQEIKGNITKRMGGQLLKEIKNSDEPINLGYIVRAYNDASDETREAINDMFISLTGYQLTTMVNAFMGGEEL